MVTAFVCSGKKRPEASGACLARRHGATGGARIVDAEGDVATNRDTPVGKAYFLPELMRLPTCLYQGGRDDLGADVPFAELMDVHDTAPASDVPTGSRADGWGLSGSQGRGGVGRMMNGGVMRVFVMGWSGQRLACGVRWAGNASCGFWPVAERGMDRAWPVRRPAQEKPAGRRMLRQDRCQKFVHMVILAQPCESSLIRRFWSLPCVHHEGPAISC